LYPVSTGYRIFAILVFVAVHVFHHVLRCAQVLQGRTKLTGGVRANTNLKQLHHSILNSSKVLVYTVNFAMRPAQGMIMCSWESWSTGNHVNNSAAEIKSSITIQLEYPPVLHGLENIVQKPQ
jgi:hypothetical protein